MSSWDTSGWRENGRREERSEESDWKESRWEERSDNHWEGNGRHEASRDNGWREASWSSQQEVGDHTQRQWQDTSKDDSWRDTSWREEPTPQENGDNAHSRWQEQPRQQPIVDPWDVGDPWGGQPIGHAASSSSSAPGRRHDVHENVSVAVTTSLNPDARVFEPAIQNTGGQWPSWDAAKDLNTSTGHGNEVAQWDGSAVSSTATAQQAARQRDFKSYQDWYIAQNILPQDEAEDVEHVERELFHLGVGQGGVGIDFALYDHVPCEICGAKIPESGFPPLASFAEIYQIAQDRVPAELESNIRRCGYENPTPVQKYSIPVGLAGRDVMCCAQTGSGKTVAFLVPILASMITHNRGCHTSDKPFSGPCKPDTLVLSPTRELCLQIYRETLKFCHKTPHRAVRVYGQEDARKQIQEVAKGADIIVATPGRLWDFVNSGIVQVTEINCLVIDEADLMITKQMDGFIKEIVENYGMPTKDNRQTMMFSATFPSDIQKMAIDYLYDHVWIGIGAVGGASSTVTQTVEHVEQEKKFDKLVDRLNNFLDEKESGERIIVFTNTKVEAKGIDDKLWDLKIDSGALHGDLDQAEREKNLQKFRDGDIDVLVATDLAARGLDIGGVTHVINYDVPREIDTYVQRIGRTGRIGRRGYATTYVTMKDGEFREDIGMLKAIVMKMEESGSTVPEWMLAANEHNKEPWAWNESEQRDARETEVKSGDWSSWKNDDTWQKDQADKNTSWQ